MNSLESLQQADKETAATLASRSVKALKWSYIGVVARIFMQLIAQIALARLLGPEPFGMVAAAILVLTVSSLVAELGMGPAIIQAQALSPLRIRVAFTRIVLASLLVGGLILFSSTHIAQFFGAPGIREILHWLLPSFIFQALGVVSLALLKRNLDFKTIQIAQVTGYFFGFLITGAGCALMGAGVWSLVAAWTVQNFLQLAIMYLRVRHQLAPAVFSESKADSGFGVNVVLTNIANWVIENIDNLIIGKFFGTNALGNYAVAYNLVRTPTNHAVNSVQQVVFPASARAQDKPEALKTAYLSTIWAIALLTFPVFTGIGTVAETFVAAIYGEKWNGAVGLLLPLALAMPMHAVMAVAGPMLWGSGAVGRELSVQFWVALMLLAALLYAATWSAAAVAWAVFFVYTIRAAWLHHKAASSLGVPFDRVLAALATGIITAAFVCLLLGLCDAFLQSQKLAPILRITIETGVALLTLLLVLFFALGKLLPNEVRPHFSKVASRLPSPIGRALLNT